MRTWWLCLVLAVGCERRTDEVPGSPPAVATPAKPAHLRHQIVHPPSDRAEGQYRMKKPGEPPPPPPTSLDPWPATPFDLATELASMLGTGGTYGTANRVLNAAADPRGRWVLMCQQRRDTDGDGEITFGQSQHWNTGDAPDAFFAIGGGAGSELDGVVAVSADGDHLVFAIDLEIILIDVPAKRGVVLPHALDVATFTADGKHVLYLDRVGAQTRVVRRELASSVTKAVALPSGDANGISTDRAGSVIVAIARTSSDPRRSPSMAPEQSSKPYAGWCSLSDPFRADGARDPVTRLRIDFETGNAIDDPAPPATDHIDVHAYNIDPALVHEGVDQGPLRWR